ncbi:MAG TPA: hypothetical protein VHZ03_06315 [Trebonia sp.]|nr:hypothetical protein [Trebonia sp.]
MREFRSLGSARGAARKGGPYRDQFWDLPGLGAMPLTLPYHGILDDTVSTSGPTGISRPGRLRVLGRPGPCHLP